jgi:hypothetical protein
MSQSTLHRIFSCQEGRLFLCVMRRSGTGTPDLSRFIGAFAAVVMATRIVNTGGESLVTTY